MATDLSPGSNLDSALETKRKLLEEYLDRHLPPEDREPRTLHQAMRYSVLSGGKRIRPLLTLLVAEAVGGNVEEALPVAAAFECIHAYSLIHDDLPCMDDDDLRRGRATNHKVYGEAMAVLAGDALLTFAFELVAEGVADPRKASAVLLDMAHFAGASGMVGGQAIDIESDGAEPDPKQLEKIHRLKTQALITASARAGVLVVGSDDETLRCVTSYGEKVGLAFQIMDDLLDEEGTTDQLGKTAGKDRTQKKLTFPRVHGRAESRARAGTLAREAKEALHPLGTSARLLLSLADYVVERKR